MKIVFPVPKRASISDPQNGKILIWKPVVSNERRLALKGKKFPVFLLGKTRQQDFPDRQGDKIKKSDYGLEIPGFYTAL